MSEAKSVDAVIPLIGLMQARPPLPKDERRRRQEEYFRVAFSRMVSSGQTYGEATGAPGTAITTTDSVEFRKNLQSIDNDLVEQVRIVTEGVNHYFAHGEFPAPYYAWRIAVILRKLKEVKLESDFLGAFNRLCEGCVGGRYSDLVMREVKSRRLAALASSDGG